MAEIAVSVALVLVEKFLIYLGEKVNRPSNADDAIKEAKSLLGRMQAYLRDSENQIDEVSQVIRNCFKEVQDSAYEIEDALDKFMLQVPYHTHNHMLSQKFHDWAHSRTERKANSELSSKIKGIKTKISFVSASNSHHLHGIEVNHPSTSRVGESHHFQVLEDDQIEGFDKHKNRLFKQLMEGDSRLLTISIVGPGGSGKTTLVKNAYDSKRVQGFFDCHDWIDVSHPLDLKKLLCNMLSNLDPKGESQEPVGGMNGLQGKLGQLLQKKRFLVVLDNVWSKQDLETILNALPKGVHGSRVIITTRKADVATCFPNHQVHDLSEGLSDENARNLFFKKAFPNSEGKCPQELKEWAKNPQ